MELKRQDVFTVYGDPVAKGRPRFRMAGKFPTTYTPGKTKQAEYDFKAQSIKHKPARPWEGPIGLSIFIYKDTPKGYSMKRKDLAEQAELRPITRPDADNYAKLVMDAMNGIFFVDDSQVVTLITGKYYSRRPRINVEIQYLEQ